MPKLRYAVVTVKRVTSKKEAKELVESDPGHSEIFEVVSPFDERCPKGSDHSHASYDGATYCPDCGRYLTIRVEKRQ